MADGGQNTQGRVTIRTVAEDAGVRSPPCRKVLRNAYGVSDALRQNVKEIERLGYRPSVAARGMRGQTYTLGVLLVGIPNPFLPLVFDGINTAGRGKLQGRCWGSALPQGRMEATLIEQMIDNRMDGLMLVAPPHGRPDA